MKTHFAYVEWGNESDPENYYSATACGMEEYECPATDKWEYVTCKRCLKRKPTAKQNNEVVTSHNQQ